MRRVLSSLFACSLLSAAAFAHGGHDHVRGTVTKIDGKSIVVQTTEKATKTVTVVETTKFEKAGKPALLTDLKVGDRVVIDLPEGKLTAEEVQIGTAAAAPAAAKATATAKTAPADHHEHK